MTSSYLWERMAARHIGTEEEWNVLRALIEISSDDIWDCQGNRPANTEQVLNVLHSSSLVGWKLWSSCSKQPLMATQRAPVLYRNWNMAVILHQARMEPVIRSIRKSANFIMRQSSVTQHQRWESVGPFRVESQDLGHISQIRVTETEIPCFPHPPSLVGNWFGTTAHIWGLQVPGVKSVTA